MMQGNIGHLTSVDKATAKKVTNLLKLWESWKWPIPNYAIRYVIKHRKQYLKHTKVLIAFNNNVFSKIT